MKKICLLLFGIFLLVSCNKGAVCGTVKYSVAEHAIPRVDYFAEIYLTRLDVDTIAEYLDVVHLQDEIQRATQTLAYVYKQNDIDSLKKLIEGKQNEFINLMPDTMKFTQLERSAFQGLERIKSDTKNTVGLQTDESGQYSVEIRAGVYQMIVVSEGAKRDNVLERHGQIYLTKTEIAKGKQALVDVTFVP